MPGITWSLGVGGAAWAKTCRVRVSVPKRLTTVTGACPSAVSACGGETLAVRVRQLCVDGLPLGLQHPAQDGVPEVVRRLFQVVKGCRGLQRRRICGRQVKGRKFPHGVRHSIIDFTNHDSDVAHGNLLIHAVCPCYHISNLTQHLFALTTFSSADERLDLNPLRTAASLYSLIA